MVSRHLIARNDRREEVLSVGNPWDLVIVDEAHAARHKGFGHNEPNQLLGLLTDLKKRRLAAFCLAHPAPNMRILVIPEPGGNHPETDGIRACLSINWISAPAHLGISPTEEILATFNGQLADRHPPTAPALDESGRMTSGREGVRLLTWGDPVLTAWLEAVRGDIDPSGRPEQGTE
jgi:hypothetical protein